MPLPSGLGASRTEGAVCLTGNKIGNAKPQSFIIRLAFESRQDDFTKQMAVFFGRQFVIELQSIGEVYKLAFFGNDNQEIIEILRCGELPFERNALRTMKFARMRFFAVFNDNHDLGSRLGVESGNRCLQLAAFLIGQKVAIVVYITGAFGEIAGFVVGVGFAHGRLATHTGRY